MSSDLPGAQAVIGKHHLQLDIDYWQTEWAASRALHYRMVDERHLCFYWLHPFEFINYDAIRQCDLAPKARHCKTVPVDLVFWTCRQALNPYLTRVGGTPFRSADKPWPQKNGVPLTFIGQLCFMDTKDILPKLPGDLMLVFASRLDELWEVSNPFKDTSGLYVEWVKIAEVTKQVSAAECVSNFYVPEYSGVLHRYYDYCFDTFDSLQIEGQFSGVSNCHDLLNICMTKMGSSYLEAQHGWDPRAWIEQDNDPRLVGKAILNSLLFGIECWHESGGGFINDPRLAKLQIGSRQQSLASLHLRGYLIFFSEYTQSLAWGSYIPDN